MMPRKLSLLLLLFAALTSVHASQTPSSPDLVLQGEVKPSQAQTYFEVPFDVPAGVHRLTVYFENFGKADRTVLDLGIVDPVRFRGASGGNKDHFTISETDATPSYLPGTIIPGKWRLQIAVPNIRPNVTSRYRAEIYFNRVIDDTSFTDHPLNDHPGWYRGDLHMHDAHSDGSCPSQSGKSVPCPVFFTVEAAARRGLDFIAISDHNTTSQYDAMRELQPYFDKTLLIPGRELTTFYGHANLIGTTLFVDYRVGSPQVPDVNAMFRSARQTGGIVSINHPESPTGEICMGCGWSPSPPADMSLVNSIEVMNGGGGGGFFPSIRFWEQQLSKGYRLTAVGGSDNHHADWPLDKIGSVGSPTTVVHANDLSVAAILDGIRAGHVFLDLTGSRDKLLELRAHDSHSSAEMGEDLEQQKGEALALQIHVTACEGASLRMLIDGQESSTLPQQGITSGDQTFNMNWTPDGSRHWLRAEVRDSQGQLLLFSNPVYIGFKQH
jgi:hypothetical protein